MIGMGRVRRRKTIDQEKVDGIRQDVYSKGQEMHNKISDL